MKKIPLTKGYEALVDDEDYALAIQFKWYPAITKQGRVYAYKNRSKINPHTSIQRTILNPPSELMVDHIDGNPLNNQRSNLRVCTPKENCRNAAKYKTATSTSFKGVTARGNSKFRARIRVDDKLINLGQFTTAEEAAKAYDEAAIHHFKEFAYLNFPQRKP